MFSAHINILSMVLPLEKETALLWRKLFELGDNCETGIMIMFEQQQHSPHQLI